MEPASTEPPPPAPKWTPVGSVRGPAGQAGPAGPAGELSPQDIPDLTVIFENGLI